MRIQKGKIRFSKRDLWNLDETLKPILHTALTQFDAVEKWGVSTKVYEDLIATDKGITVDEAKEYIKEHRDQQGDVEGYTNQMLSDYFKNVIMKDMIFAFADHPDYTDIEKRPYEITMNMDGEVRPDGNKRTFIEYVWDKGITQDDVNAYAQREKAYDEMVQERSERGRYLFAKYFESLWD